VAQTFTEDFTRRRNGVPADRLYFTGTLAGGIRFMGDARDFRSALHTMGPGFNSIVIGALT
jgi:hypothetical protein